MLFLHGLGASGKILVDALGVPAIAEKHKLVYAAPDGRANKKGQRFWNASRSCCDFDHDAPNHVSELGDLIAAAAARPDVDPKRVFVVGFSNGGFMAHRLACDVPGIAGIVSIAGAGPGEADAPCKPKAPVAVLQIHGDADPAVPYDGGRPLGRADLAPAPSALDTVKGWAGRDGCSATAADGGKLDLEAKLDGEETSVARFTKCGKPVELWSVKGGNHFVAMGERGLDAAISYLERASSK